MFRQGDVAIFPLALAEQLFPFLTDPDGQHGAVPEHEEAPRDANGNVILAYGETSGHMHAVIADERDAIKNPVRWNSEAPIITFEVTKETEVGHIGYEGPRDHDSILLPPGKWVSVGQREYSPLTAERPVFD